MPDNVHRSTRYENLILKEKSFSPELRSILAGSSRAARLSHELAAPRERVVSEVAAGVLAPLTFLYACWVLTQAKRQGIRRLFFLARDGRLMMEAAQIIAERWNIDIELRYLHTSREAWLLPSFQEFDSFSISWITWGYLSSITVEEVERRLDLPKGGLWSRLQGMPVFSGADPLSSLDAGQLTALKEVLALDEVVKEIRGRSDLLLKTVAGHLEGQGLFDGTRYALVDTGWKGTSQYGLSRLLNKLGRRPSDGVIGFYLGLNVGYHKYPGDSAIPYLFNWDETTINYRLYSFLCFELLLSTCDGRTIGYSGADSGFAPVFAENLCRENWWAIDIHHKAVRRYAEYASRFIGPADIGGEGARLIRKLAAFFISKPTPEEAEVYGDMLIAGEMGERDLQPLAPRMKYSDLLLILTKRQKIRGFWPQGSMSRSFMRFGHAAYCMFLDLKLLDWYRKVILRY